MKVPRKNDTDINHKLLNRKKVRWMDDLHYKPQKLVLTCHYMNIINLEMLVIENGNRQSVVEAYNYSLPAKVHR